MSDHRIDSHKLIFHPRRVADWLEGKTVYPIFLELGISGACNHRCVFCTVSHMKYEPTYIDAKVLLEQLRLLKQYGLKSVLLAGNGEPTLHKNFSTIVNEVKLQGIDIALSTNGVLFTPDKVEECLESISWVRYSISAGTEATYKQIHRGNDGDLQRVFDNIQYAVEYKRKNRLKTVIGVQIVMTLENASEIVLLAKTAKDLGADLFSVKVVGYNPLSTQYKDKVADVVNSGTSELERQLHDLSDENFVAMYRENRATAMVTERNYTECHASPFYGCIDSDGKVYPCCNFIGIADMALGSIYEQSFVDIWNGNRRKDIMEGLASHKLKECVPSCRLDRMNEYLQELKYPDDHVNFI